MGQLPEKCRYDEEKVTGRGPDGCALRMEGAFAGHFTEEQAMFRIRVTMITAGLIVAMASIALDSQAQPPAGGGGGRGQRGQRGGFGGPGGPGGFGQGSDLLQLANNDVVQKEIKMTDRQKASVKSLSDDQNTKRRDTQQKMRQQLDQARNQATRQAQTQAQASMQPQVDPSAMRGAGAGNALVGALNNRGYQPQVYGGQVYGGQGQMDPAMRQQMARAQGRMAANGVQQQGFMMMRQVMQQLQQAGESSLARILDKNQMKRLREISLQSAGPAAVLREDVVEKLEITPDQVTEIQQTVNESNQARRQLMAQSFQFMRSLMPAPPPGNGQAANNGAGNGQGGGRRRGQQGQGGQGTQGAQAGQMRKQARVHRQAKPHKQARPGSKARMVREEATGEGRTVGSIPRPCARSWSNPKSRRRWTKLSSRKGAEVEGILHGLQVPGPPPGFPLQEDAREAF